MTQSNKDNGQKKLPRQKPRTCVACRSEAPKRVLLRIVRKPDGTAIVDPTGKLPGRGAYICANPDCLETARKTGALARALKLRSLPDECYADLARCIKNELELESKLELENGPSAKESGVRELKSLIGLSRRAGLVKIGVDAIDSEAKSRHLALKHEALLVLTARDCSESVLRFVENLVAQDQGQAHEHNRENKKHAHHEHQELPLTIDELSAALGAGKVQVIAMSLNGGLADKIKASLRAAK